jgi:hypothetical protein
MTTFSSFITFFDGIFYNYSFTTILFYYVYNCLKHKSQYCLFKIPNHLNDILNHQIKSNGRTYRYNVKKFLSMATSLLLKILNYLHAKWESYTNPKGARLITWHF